MSKSQTASAPTKDVTLMNGTVLTVHAVPLSELLGMVSAPEPEIPKIAMVLATGETQYRHAKEGDPEWEAYDKAIKAWNTERNRLYNDVTLVMAMGDDFEFPEPLVFPKNMQRLIDCGLKLLPENEFVRKAMWLHSTILASSQDQMDIDLTVQELSGTPVEVTRQIRENFLDSLRRSATKRVGEDTAPADKAE